MSPSPKRITRSRSLARTYAYLERSGKNIRPLRREVPTLPRKGVVRVPSNQHTTEEDIEESVPLSRGHYLFGLQAFARGGGDHALLYLKSDSSREGSSACDRPCRRRLGKVVVSGYAVSLNATATGKVPRIHQKTTHKKRKPTSGDQRMRPGSGIARQKGRALQSYTVTRSGAHGRRKGGRRILLRRILSRGRSPLGTSLFCGGGDALSSSKRLDAPGRGGRGKDADALRQNSGVPGELEIAVRPGKVARPGRKSDMGGGRLAGVLDLRRRNI